MREFVAEIRGMIFSFRCKYARNNIHVGRGLKIYKRLIVHGEGTLTIGENCIVGGIRGDREQYVCLDTLNGDAKIEIGNNARLYAARLSSRYSIILGDDVHIEEAGIMDTDFHSIGRLREDPANESRETCEVAIGNRVQIGARSLITKGVKINDDAVIGPGSVVTRSVPAACLVFGNPAKLVAAKS